MYLDKELDYLNQLLMKMADLVQRNINEAVKIFSSGKNNECKINDDIIDQYERLVEEVCLDIMLKERLYAKDLRKVTGILRMVADLERIGDHAEDIVHYCCKLTTIEKTNLKKIDKMLEDALSMVNDSILSFVKEDIKLAENVVSKDDIVDKAFDELLKHFITELDTKNITPNFAIYTTLVVKYIERIADHAVNIAEWVIYIINGYYKDKQIF